MSISTTLTWSVTDTTRDTSDGFIVGADVALTGIATITSGKTLPVAKINVGCIATIAATEIPCSNDP